ncbi:MAG: deoxyguanosinetriphosphate triphosphohydrolase [bacterium]|nr:deoxyguanosinetriphosphate triphosphohydrolase [bacterium]
MNTLHSAASSEGTPEKSADQLLAPYAMLHRNYGGRLNGDEPHSYRTVFQRDRDRVIHCKGFRRLGYKTQVFVNHEGDNYRTRLTHSLEVAQISRSICGALRLNQDFAETLALAHDLGHTPFGHAGQDALNRLMRDHGGFEHNCQSLRLVTKLESRYLDYRGLNLTRASLKGMLKHASVYECDDLLAEICAERGRENMILEAALVDHCDRLAYIHHDLEDGLDSGILQRDDLSELSIWRDAYQAVEKKSGQAFRHARGPLKVRAVIRYLMDRSISDLYETTRANLQALQPKNQSELLEKGPGAAEYPVRYSAEMREILGVCQKFLFRRLYRYPRVERMSRRGARIIELLFYEYVERPGMMPEHFQREIDSVGVYRVVSDYIAGMTDRFAAKEYRSLTGEV